MAKSKVIVDYSTNRYSDNDLTKRASGIVSGLTDNLKFQELAPIVPVIKTKNDYFAALLIKMLDGGKTVTIEKNTARTDLEDILGSTAVRVQDLSNGDELLIVGAGFEVKRKASPVGLLDMPANVTAKAGPTRGSLEISWNVVQGAYMYEIEYISNPETDKSPRERTSTTKHKVVIDGLTRGQAYAIRVAAAGSDPGRVWSDVIISYVM